MRRLLYQSFQNRAGAAATPDRHDRRSNARRTIARGLLAFCAAACFLLPGALYAQISVTVRVFDPQSNASKPDAQVIVLETRQRYYTEADGTVQVQLPEPGFYTFRVILPDGTLVQPRLQATASGQTLTVFTSEPSGDGGGGDDGGGITVRGEREKQKGSRYQVRLDEIKRIPGQFGEALRGIESLPGVNAPPFGNGEIVIRGADQGSNTYLLDDLPIGYAFHFFPVNSVLANDFISTIDIYMGAYPAEYGNATGGVIDIKSIDDVEKFGGNANFSLWSANALFKGVIPAWGSEEPETGSAAAALAGYYAQADTQGEGAANDESGEGGGAGSSSDSGYGGYWIGAGRISYLHIMFSSLVPDGIQLPIYYDGQAKVMLRFGPEHQFYFYGLGAKDTFAVDAPDGPQYDPTKDPSPIFIGANVALEQAYHTEAIRHVWTPGAKFQNRATILYHENLFFVNGRLGNLEANQEVKSGYTGFRDDAYWTIIRDHIDVELGFEVRRFFYQNNGITIRQTDPFDETPDFFGENDDFDVVNVRDNETVGYNSGWGMLSLKGWGFTFRPGVRVDYFGLTEQTVTDPRGELSYEFPTKTTLIASGGVYHRLPDANEYSPTSGNPNLRLERAEHYAGGIQQEIGDWLAKIEFFRFYFDDLVVVDPYVVTPVRQNQDPFTRFERPFLFNDPLGYSNDGEGWSEGFEVFLKKSKPPEVDGWYGWISYTYSRAFRNDRQFDPSRDPNFSTLTRDELRVFAEFYDNSRETIADFDRTHIINVIFGYKFNPEWQLGVRWSYRTGTPFTPITGDDGGVQRNAGVPIFDPIYSEWENEARIKPFHRLDIRIDRFLRYDWGYGNIYFEMLNVYVRRNETGRQWDRGRPFSATNPSPSYDFVLLESPDGETWYPFFNIGIEVKF